MKRILLAAAAVLSIAAANGKEYRPVLEEGKSWIMCNHRTDPFNIDKLSSVNYGKYLKVECLGSSMVDGEAQWTVRLSNVGGAFAYPGEGSELPENEYIDFTLYEKDGVVSNQPNGKMPIIDLSSQKGDKLEVYRGNKPTGEFLTVSDETTATVGETDFRELIINSGSWVEGIGAQSLEVTLMQLSGPTSVDISTRTDMDACYLNGVKIFGREDFANPQSRPQRPAILTDNKEWLLEETVTVNGSDEKEVYLAVATLSNSINIDGHKCHTLTIKREGTTETSPLSYTLCEEYGILYLVTENEGSKPTYNALMNFNCSKGDLISLRNSKNEVMGRNLVYDSHKKEIDGEVCRELQIGRLEDSSHMGCWVEGIGSSTAMTLTSFERPTLAGAKSSTFRMLECRKDGKVIFTSKDFTASPDASLSEINASSETDLTVYDLLGRRIAKPIDGKIYIQNGKKFRK